MSQLVQVHASRPLVLFRPEHTPARPAAKLEWVGLLDSNQIEPCLRSISGPCVLDLETRGTKFWSTECYPVMLGLAWSGGRVCVDMQHLGTTDHDLLTRFLLGYPDGFLAHNAYFDFGFLYNWLGGKFPRILGCTYAYYTQLAGEGWMGQRWGLKTSVQPDILMWEETNDIELDAWLVAEGYVNAAGRPLKSEMWRAPADILATYCMLDCEATYLFWHHHILPLLDEFPVVREYHEGDFLNLVRLLIKQTTAGLLINTKGLVETRAELEAATIMARDMFLTQPEIAPHIQALHDFQVAASWDAQPPRLLKQEPKKEPVKYTKSGKISVSWRKWSEKPEPTPKVAARWLAWERKHEILVNRKPHEIINVGSQMDMCYLLIDCLGLPVVLETKSGMPSVGEDALRTYGEVARMLIEHHTSIKEIQYIDSYLEYVTEEGVLHAGWRVPGTVTGRVSGSEPNLMQIPKSLGVLRNFIPRPGCVWIDYDLSAIEMVVMAEISEDPGLMSIYGPDAQPNDIYLFIGSQLPVIGPAIRACGYDPYNPTPETIKAAKAGAKTERSIAKTFVLASNYGAYPPKLHRTLTLQGIKISIHDVEQMFDMFWRVLGGITEYKERLREEWRINGGWVANPMGRPMCVDSKLTKDLANRVCQSGGHDILLRYISIFSRRLDEAGVSWTPIVVDWHDQSIIEVPEDQAALADQIMKVDSFAELNQQMAGIITLKGSGGIVRSLAESKLEM